MKKGKSTYPCFSKPGHILAWFLALSLVSPIAPILGQPTQRLSTENEDSTLKDLLPSESVITLTLQEAVLQAIENNLDIQISRYNRDVQITDIMFQEAVFDPTVSLEGLYERDIRPLNRPVFGFGGAMIGDDPDVFDQNDTRLNLGLEQKLITGGTYNLDFDNNRNSVAGRTGFLFNPGYASTLSLNLTHPLLRNFGPSVNSTQITIAKNSAYVEDLAFIQQLMIVIAQVEETYWELVFARDNLKITRASLRAAEELLNSNKSKVQAGVMAEVEVLQAQAGVASRVEQILLAQKTVHDQEDQLRRLLNKSEYRLTQTTPLIPLDPPNRTRPDTTLQGHLQLALDQRPEVLQAKKNVETADVNTKFAKNQLLPDLSFQGGFGLVGLGEDPGDSLDRMGSTDFYNMSGGLILSYPIGNRSAKSQHQRRMLEGNQTRASLARIRQQIIVDVKEALRQVDTNFKRIRTNRTSRELADKQLKAEEERLQLGLSTTRRVIEFQRDLRIAQGRELRAILDFNKSLARLRLVTASAPEHYNITVK